MAGGLIARGDIYLGTFDASTGNFLGYYNPPVNGVTLNLTPGEATEIERISRMRDTAGQALSSVSIPGPWSLTFATDEMGNKQVIGMALSGGATAINETGQAVTDEAVTGQHDLWVPLAGRNLDTGTAPTVTDAAGTTTYVANTDYEIDFRNGRIRVLSSGSITDGESLLVDYTTFTVTGTEVTGATKQNVRTRIFFDGLNLDGDKPITLLIKDVGLRATGGVDFITDEFAAAELEGTLVTPPGESGPFEYEELTLAAA